MTPRTVEVAIDKFRRKGLKWWVRNYRFLKDAAIITGVGAIVLSPVIYLLFVAVFE